jgi:toxin ParE1/3/4
MNVVITEPAERDLFGIQRYIAADNPARAETFIAELERICTVVLPAAPEIGALRNEISPGLRAHGHKNYLICYRIIADVIHVVRIFHGSYDITRRF